MKAKIFHLSDIMLLVKLFSGEAACPYIFDPFNRLLEDQDDCDEQDIKEGSKVLVNLAARLTSFKGQRLESFDFIIDFGAALIPEGYEEKTLHFVKQPDGKMRWLFQKGKLSTVLPFYNASGRRGHLLAAGIKLLSFLGLGFLFAHGCIRVYGKKTSMLDKWITQYGTTYSVFLGTPGLQRSILLALTNQQGTRRFIKIPAADAATSLVKNEVEAINVLKEKRVSHIKYPSIRELDSSGVILSNNLESVFSKRSSAFSLKHASAIAITFEKEAGLKALCDTTEWKQSIQRLSSTAPSKMVLKELFKLCGQLSNYMDEHLMVYEHWAHGDFTPWNMFIENDRLLLYDWELWKSSAPAFYDLFHFHYQKGILMEQLSYKEIQQEIEKSFCLPPLKRLLNKHKIDVSFLHRLYLIHTISYYIKVYDQQDLSQQNLWQIREWKATLQQQLYQLKDKVNCRKHFINDLQAELQSFSHAFLKFDCLSLGALAPSSDLDIAIEKKDKGALFYFLCKHPLIAKIKLKKKSFMTTAELYFRDNAFLSLDLIHDFRRKQLRLLAVEDLLAESRKNTEGISVPAVKHDLAYAYAFYTLNKASIPLRYYSFFSSTSAVELQEALSFLNQSFGTSFSILEQVFASGREEKKKLEKTLKESPVWQRALGTINYYFDTLSSLLFHRGFMITFSGVDGVGKSTVIQKVKQELEQQYRREVVLLRHRPGILPILSALRHGKEKAEQIASESIPRKGKNKSRLSSILRFTYYYTDYLLGQGYVFFRYLLRGKVVLYDRYYFDFINDARRSNIQLNRKLAKLLYRLIMKPRLNIFLYAEPDTILARKQELEAKDILHLSKGYQRLFRELGREYYQSKYLSIENRSLENTLQEVLKEFASVA